jgi:hypothetical protein
MTKGVIAIKIILIIILLILSRSGHGLPLAFALLPFLLIETLVRKEKWSNPLRDLNKKHLLTITGIIVIWQIISVLVLTPLIANITEEQINLEQFVAFSGNLLEMILLVVVAGWLIGGVIEELAYRKFILNTLVETGDGKLSIIMAVLVTSVIFALGHEYQGIAGIINSFISSVIFSYIYLKMDKRLIYPIFAHALYDTLGFLAIFLHLV